MLGLRYGVLKGAHVLLAAVACVSLELHASTANEGAQKVAAKAVQVPPAPPIEKPQYKKPVIEDLGNQQYRIGSIEVDKAKARFELSGVLLRVDGPLEFLAVTKGGMKAYESVFELDSDAFEFNLACILIGLDAKNAKASEYHFDERVVEGDQVSLSLSWLDKGKRVEVKAAEVLLEDGKQVASNDWRYTGSLFMPSGHYAAAESGTLVGFVHDPESIIEHRDGVGLKNYGAITLNKSVIPAEGSKITLSVSVVKPADPVSGSKSAGKNPSK